jgi:hypothetical protein
MDMKMAIKVIKKMKSENTSMKFVNLGSIEDLVLEGYGDAGLSS